MENTNRINGFNFNQNISKNAIGKNKLFLYVGEEASDGYFIKNPVNDKSIIFINKNIDNFDEFITILFHELGHYVLHADAEKLKHGNYKDENIKNEIEHQANKFAEHMRHILYNSIELSKLLK